MLEGGGGLVDRVALIWIKANIPIFDGKYLPIPITDPIFQYNKELNKYK